MNGEPDPLAHRWPAGLVAMALAAAAALTISVAARATEDYAKQTGQSCAQCHRNAAGGGPLTPAGAAFKANGADAPAASGPSADGTPPTTPDADSPSP